MEGDEARVGAPTVRADDAVSRRVREHDRSRALGSALGAAIAALVFLMVARSDVASDRAVVWAVGGAVAVVTIVAGVLFDRRSTVGLVGHALLGACWGALLLLWNGDPNTLGLGSRFLWIVLAFQFAVTAAVLAGRAVDHLLARAVVGALWGVAAVILAVIGLPLLALVAVAFLVLIRRDLLQSSAFLVELVEMRHAASRRADRASEAAQRDPLTGLLNRDGLAAALHEQPEVGAAFFIDLDRFKEINDRHGHQVGDEVLAAVGRRLRSVFRGEDLLARLGGDEFLAVLAGRHETELLAARAAEVIAILETPVEVDGEAILCSASVGVAEIPPGLVDVDRVMRESDHAMYRAKRSGRRRAVLFDAEHRAEMVDRADLSAALRLAVREHRIDVWGQPMIELTTAEVTGVELLARWRGADGAWIPARRFIPVAESIGLSGEIALTVMARAEELFHRWRDHPRLGAARLSLNLSVVDLADERLVDTLLATVDRCGVEPSRFVVEITESGLLAPEREARAALERIAAHGVTIALDDFGTGSSSIAGLLGLPLTTVKLDRHLIAWLDDPVEHPAGTNGDSARDDGLPDGDVVPLPSRYEVVRSIVGLARTLGRQPVAGGVETIEQLDAVAELGVGHAQGYLLCPPLPLDELEGPIGSARLAELVPRPGARVPSNGGGPDGAPVLREP